MSDSAPRDSLDKAETAINMAIELVHSMVSHGQVAYELGQTTSEIENIKPGHVLPAKSARRVYREGGSTPSQYGVPDGTKDLQDLIEYRDMNFAMGNIFKACYRMNNCSHSDEERDLRKIIWFAERELKRVHSLRNK